MSSRPASNRLRQVVDANQHVHDIYQNDKMRILQSTITKLETRLREADRLNKDHHRVELIKSLRMQLRESLTMNETLITICGQHGIERRLIEPQLDAARSKVKLVGIKKISEMRQEIEMLRLQLKRARTNKSVNKSIEVPLHIDEEKEHDHVNENERMKMLNESLQAECDALKHRLIVTIDTLKALEERFHVLSDAHSHLKISTNMHHPSSFYVPSQDMSADVLVDHDEAERIEQHWTNEVKKLKVREARLLDRQRDMQHEIDNAQTDMQQLVNERDDIEEQLIDKNEMLEELQLKHDATKAKLKRLQKHMTNEHDDDDVRAENFRLKERIVMLEKRSVNTTDVRSSSTSTSSCRQCYDNIQRVNELRAELKVARMINEAIKDANNEPNAIDVREFDMESMIELSEGYEKQIANMKDTIEQLQKRQSSNAHSTRYSDQSSADECTSSDSDDEMSLHDLEAEIKDM